MKRHLLPLLGCFILWACTPVDDFGAYWLRGGVDPVLEGTWKKIGLPGERDDLTGIPGPDMMVFEKNGSSYSLHFVNPGASKEENEAAWTMRTLEIGKHGFMMMKGKADGSDGYLEQYEIHGDILDENVLENGAGVDWLKAKHPTAANIVKNTGEGSYVVIKTFDDEVFRILSEIADDPVYWMMQCQYKKVESRIPAN
ncbi:MAG: hypothetical protein ND807_08380 [Vicinamibacterales bacterium]|nr:hypothetical protein [Vicinamibacterales bacterium]